MLETWNAGIATNQCHLDEQSHGETFARLAAHRRDTAVACLSHLLRVLLLKSVVLGQM